MLENQVANRTHYYHPKGLARDKSRNIICNILIINIEFGLRLHISTRANRGNDGDLIAFLDYILSRVFIGFGELDIVEIDCHQARSKDFIFDAIVFLF